jgi:hypothetical protein
MLSVSAAQRCDVKLKARLIQQVILEQQARIGRFVEGGDRRKGVRHLEQLAEPVLEAASAGA